MVLTEGLDVLEQSRKAKEHRNGFNCKIIIAITTYLGKNQNPSAAKFLAPGNATEPCRCGTEELVSS